MAIISGLRAAAAILTGALLVQITDMRLDSLANLVVASMSASFSLLSEWFISVPTAPVSLIESARTWPVKLPGFIGSICCAKTGTDTCCAIVAMSANWGATPMQVSVSRLTFSAIIASLSAFFPVASR